MEMSLDRVQWSAKRMKGTSTNASSKHTRLLFGTGSLCGLTDRQLLDLFLARHGNGDEADAEVAFEVLVKRHGPMVARLCRSLINDHHDADDAFQATFLVLARRAAAIRDREAVASWLYGVATRVAARRELKYDVADCWRTSSPTRLATRPSMSRRAFAS